MTFRRQSILPGFWPAFSYTTLYLTLIVLIPLSAVFLKSFTVSWAQFTRTVLAPPVLAAYKLSFGASLVAGAISALVGFLIAWVLVRYEFQGKSIADALVDLPFALPTAVAGIALTSLYTESGWIGRYLAPLGIKVAFTPLGIIVALTFIGLPFVVRSVQPVLGRRRPGTGRSGGQPGRNPLADVLQGDFAHDAPRPADGIRAGLCARAGRVRLGNFHLRQLADENGNRSALIVTKLEQYDYAGATAIAVVMLIVSFILLLGINVLQRRTPQFLEKAR